MMNVKQHMRKKEEEMEERLKKRIIEKTKEKYRKTNNRVYLINNTTLRVTRS